MPEHKQVYDQEAHSYQRLIAREDYQHNLLPALRGIAALEDLDAIDLGAGTGRLAYLLAPLVRSICAFDLSPHMLEVAAAQLNDLGTGNWLTAASDHRRIPLVSASTDLVISGWSFCYLVVWEDRAWEAALDSGLAEINRVLRNDGLIIIVETLGTGVESPAPPVKLQEYYKYLDQAGFQRTWLRTDYQFQDREEAVELTHFFFGEDMLIKIGTEDRPILPECTGIWWKKKSRNAQEDRWT
jgi:SAM-dependent methyltransferase